LHCIFLEFHLFIDFKCRSAVDTLFDFLNLPGIKENLYLLNYIAECILKFDNISEEALALKCSTLCKLGKKGLAKAVYDNFARKYVSLLGTDYPISFNDIINQTD